MVFLHGTAIMHATAAGRPRAKRVRQSRRRDPSVLDYASYVPTEAAVAKVLAWQRHGAQICYLSSHRAAADVQLDSQVLATGGFPSGDVFFRGQDETYAGVTRRAGADVLVEDDCESIGGHRRTTASELARTTGHAVTCVILPEFGGLAHLPDDPKELASLPSGAGAPPAPGEPSQASTQA